MEWLRNTAHAARCAPPDDSIVAMQNRANPIAIDDVIEMTPPV